MKNEKETDPLRTVLSFGVRLTRIEPKHGAAFRAGERPLSGSALGAERQTAAGAAEINVALSVAEAVAEKPYFRKQGREKAEKGGIFLRTRGIVLREDAKGRVKGGDECRKGKQTAACKQNDCEKQTREGDQSCRERVGTVSAGKKITPLLQVSSPPVARFRSKTDFYVKSIAQKPIFVKPCF